MAGVGAGSGTGGAPDIELLFGVKGGGSVSGESGARIKRELDDIVKEINSKPLGIEIGLNLDRSTKAKWKSDIKTLFDSLKDDKNGQFAVTVSHIKISAGAIAEFKRQLGDVINTLSLKNGVSVTVDAKGVGEIKKEVKQAKQSFDDATRSAAEFKVQLSSLDSTSTDIRKAIKGATTVADSNEAAKIADITERYEQWKIALEQVRIEKKFAENGDASLASLEAEGNAILDVVNAIIKRGEAYAQKSKDTDNEIQKSRQVAEVNKQIADTISEIEKKQKNFSAAKFGRSSKEYAGYSELLGKLQGMSATTINLAKVRTELSQVREKMAQYTQEIQRNGEAHLSLTDRVGNLAAKFGIWLSASRVIMAGVRSIRQMIKASTELDSAMAQMQIVTRASNKEMAEFAESAAKAAQRIGSSIKDFTDSATTFARLGYNTNESSMLAEYTAMLQNVGDIDVKSAQDAVTAIIKAFDIDVSDIESVMDKLVTTGNNFPISVSQIAEGMNNASSALAAAGNTFDQSVALLTAANTTIQDAAKSSTGLRTIAARLRNTKNELDELGESFESDAKYEELVNGLTKANVTLKTATGEFRSTYDIIADIAKVWDNLTSMEQAGLATAISGTRQQAVFYSLVGQFKEASGAMDAMANSSGALTDAYSVYMDTIQAHVNQFKAAFESLSQTAIDKGFVTGFIDFGAEILKVVENVFKLIDALGGLKAVLISVGAALVAVNFGTVINTISSAISYIVKYGEAISSAASAMSAFRSAGWLFGGTEIGAGFKALTATVQGTHLAFLGAAAAAGVLLLIINKIVEANKRAHPSLEQLVQDYDEQTKKINELKSAFDQNYDRIKELNEIKKTDGLDLVQQDELSMLEEENSLLAAQIALEQQSADAAAKAAAEKAKARAQELLSTSNLTTTEVDGRRVSVRTTYGAGGVQNALEDYNSAKAANDAKAEAEAVDRLVALRKELVETRGPLLIDKESNAEEIAGIDRLIDMIDMTTDRANVFSRVFSRFFKSSADINSKNIEKFVEYLQSIGYETSGLDTSEAAIKKFFDAVEESSGKAGDALEDTTNKLEKLAQIEKNFKSLSSAVDEYEKNGAVSAQTFESLEAVYGGTEAWNNFVSILSNTESKLDDVKDAANDLASDWVSSNNRIEEALQDLNSTNVDAKIQLLENMGVVNAEQVVYFNLANQMLDTAAASGDMTDATRDEIAALLTHAGVTNGAAAAMDMYRQKQLAAKLETINFVSATKESIAALLAEAAAANASKEVMTSLKFASALKDDTKLNPKKREQLLKLHGNKAKDGLNSYIPDEIKIPEIDLSKIITGGSGSNGGSAKSAAKDLELYVAEVERYREELEKLSRIRIHKEDLSLAIEEEKDLEKKVDLYHAILTAYGEEQKSLERLQELRRQDISSGVSDLRGMGFTVEYSPENDELFIRNKEHINELYGNNTEETNELRKSTEELIKDLEDLNRENQEGKDTWQELGKAANSAKVAMIDTLKDIVTNASGAVDSIQNVYSVLHKAADEFSANGGFISVDTFQEIVGLGAQYMQYLSDQNGMLVINEESINKVIAAKTEELAIDTAMSYVERLRLAMQKDSVESLNELLYATQDTANATWDLVYANLKMLGLDDQQYAAALHNINGIRAMARAAIDGIGRTQGEALDRLNDMEKGTGDILKYVMDMLKQRIQDEIDALEKLKDQFSELIDLKKESLKQTKEESDYQKKVAQRIKEIAKLQAQIDALSLDNSRSAQAQRAKLLEELAQMQEELDNEQAEHAISAQEESLDKMKEMYEAEKDEEIKTLEDTISSYQKLYDMAIDYIENHWDTLYNELIDWNTEYGLILAHQYRKVLHKITRICWNPLKPCTTTSE